MKPLVLLPSILVLLSLCHLSQGGLTHLLAKKFIGAKLFKKMKALNQCDVVWESASHPHCQTTWDKVCEPVFRDQCNTEYIQQCTHEIQTNCKTEAVQQCETIYIDMCETEAVETCVDTLERKCETEYVQECWEEDEKDCRSTQECGTKLDKVCSTIKKWICDKVQQPEPEGHYTRSEPEPESSYARVEPEPEGRYYAEPEAEAEGYSRQSAWGSTAFTSSIKKFAKRSADQLVVRNVEEEMMDRFEKLPMRDLLQLTDKMTEDDFEKDEADEQLEAKLSSRKKRATLGHLAGVIGLSALYKKFLSTQDECRQVEHPHCVELPVESCYDVRKCKVNKVPKCRRVPQEKCWDEPKENCWTEPKQTCWQQPKEKCYDVPEEHCWDEPKEKCWQEPQETCFQVADEKCHDVPTEKCENVQVRVKKRKCNDNKKF